MSVMDDQVRLRHMLEASQQVVAFTQDETRQSLESDQRLQLALMRLIEVIGEAASRITPNFRESHREIPWNKMIGMRNRLIHAYFTVDLDRVWETATLAIPALIPHIEQLLNPPPPAE